MGFNPRGVVVVEFRLKSGSFSNVWASAYGRSGRAGNWFGDLPLRPGCPVLLRRSVLVMSPGLAFAGALYRRAVPVRYARGPANTDPPDATPCAQLGPRRHIPPPRAGIRPYDLDAHTSRLVRKVQTVDIFWTLSACNWTSNVQTSWPVGGEGAVIRRSLGARLSRCPINGRMVGDTGSTSASRQIGRFAG